MAGIIGILCSAGQCQCGLRIFLPVDQQFRRRLNQLLGERQRGAFRHAVAAGALKGDLRLMAEALLIGRQFGTV